MRPIEINLATRPFRNNTLYWAGFGSAALALVAVSVVNVSFFLGYGSTMRQHQEDLTSKERRHGALARDERQLSVKLTKLDFKGLSQQSEFANDAIRRRIFSWTELFNRLEEVVPPPVMMISIRPEIQADGISIVAEGSAKDQEGLLQFEENLIRNSRFSRIYPGSERREQRGRDIRFSLRFDYVPDGGPRTAATAAVAKGPEPPAKETASEETPAPLPTVAAVPPAATPGAKVPEVPAEAAPPPSSTGPAASGPSPEPPGVRGQVAATGPPAVSPPTSSSPPAASAPTAGQGTVQQQRPVTPRPPAARGGPRRPPVKPGSMGRSTSRPDAGKPLWVPPEKGTEQQTALFEDRPLRDVFEYLMKIRGMTFVFAGDFDLGQRVTLDLNRKEESEILGELSGILDCVIAQEGNRAYRLSPKSGGEPLEEPPVEEETAPPDDSAQGAGGDTGQDSGQDSPGATGQEPGQDPNQDPGQEEPW